MAKSWIERTAEALRLIPTLPEIRGRMNLPRLSKTSLLGFPPPERRTDGEKYEAKAWRCPKKRRYRLLPTTWFNWESPYGLVAYLEKATGRVRRFEATPTPPPRGGEPARKGRPLSTGSATLSESCIPASGTAPGAVGASELRTGAGGDHRPDPHPPGLGAPQRVGVPCGAPRPRGLHGSGASHLGGDGHKDRTNICSAGALLDYSICQGVDPLAGIRQYPLHPAAQLAPGNGPLLQPPRPAHR